MQNEQKKGRYEENQHLEASFEMKSESKAKKISNLRRMQSIVNNEGETHSQSE